MGTSSSLVIQLDNSGFLVPGSTVTGKVYLDVKKEKIDAESVMIRFENTVNYSNFLRPFVINFEPKFEGCAESKKQKFIGPQVMVIGENTITFMHIAPLSI